MTDEPKFMLELHAIRDKIHDETKEMTTKEFAEHIRREVAPLMAERGWKYAEPPVKAKSELAKV